MDGIFHYGTDSEQYIHDFESKWADYALQSIIDWTPQDLTMLLCLLKQGDHTFAKSESTEV